MKRINQLDNDLDKAQEQLAETNNKLEEANKKSADVSVDFCFFIRENFNKTDALRYNNKIQLKCFLPMKVIYI